MNKLVGITGSGMIGRDPFDPYCWSGSSRNLFLALQHLNALEDAFGVEATDFKRYLLLAKNFQTNKRFWRSKFNLDPVYYSALTQAVKKQITQYNDVSFLQLGAIYDVPSLVNGKKCFSYHDGNVAQLMKSPIFPKQLLPYAQKAFEWEKRIYDKLDKIFAMSEYLRQSFINDFDLSPDKVINVGVGANFEVPETLPNKDYSNKEILFIGADFNRKGGELLVRAFKQICQTHQDAILHIVGPRQTPEILNKVHCSNIEYHGFLSRAVPIQREKFFSLMERCTLQVLPSLYEPFGIAILESMVYGMPCIATNKWAFPEMICPGKTGTLVEPNDLDNLVFAIDSYLGDSTMREQHGAAAREFVMQNYSWDKVAQKITQQANE